MSNFWYEFLGYVMWGVNLLSLAFLIAFWKRLKTNKIIFLFLFQLSSPLFDIPAYILAKNGIYNIVLINGFNFVFGLMFYLYYMSQPIPINKKFIRALIYTFIGATLLESFLAPNIFTTINSYTSVFFSLSALTLCMIYHLKRDHLDRFTLFNYFSIGVMLHIGIALMSTLFIQFLNSPNQYIFRSVWVLTILGFITISLSIITGIWRTTRSS